MYFSLGMDICTVPEYNPLMVSCMASYEWWLITCTGTQNRNEWNTGL